MSLNFTYKNKSWKNNSQLTNSLIPSNSRPTESSGPEFKANPIRHWRKQLIPTNGVNSSKATINDINMPGGTSNNESYSVCPNCADKNVNFVTTYVPYKSLDAQPRYPDPLKGDAYYNENIRHMVCRACNPEAHRIKSSATVISKQYHDTMHSYLRSKDKLYSQNVGGLPSNQGVSGEYDSSYCSNICKNGSSKVVYKPNNFKYLVQGAVSSSSRLLNLKYNTITNNAHSFKTAYGSAAANAGKYNGSSNGPYFIKSKESKPVCHVRNGVSEKYKNCGGTSTPELDIVIFVDHDSLKEHMFDSPHLTVYLKSNVDIYLQNEGNDSLKIEIVIGTLDYKSLSTQDINNILKTVEIHISNYNHNGEILQNLHRDLANAFQHAHREGSTITSTIVKGIQVTTITGTTGDDVLYGGAGDDVIYGLSGDDIIYGGAGDDVIYVGDGNNVIYGGAGDDTIYVGDGDDVIYYDVEHIVYK